MRQIFNNSDFFNSNISLKGLINEPLNNLDKFDKNYDKKVLEICHVGKFLMILDSGYTISEVRERPDFIINSSDNFKVGLEHEILVDQDYKKVEGSYNDLIKTTEDIFRKKHPEINLLINICVNVDKNIRKQDKNQNVHLLLSMIEDFLFNDKFIVNDLVHNITWHKHSRLTFNCNPGAWIQHPLKEDILIQTINKKASKRLNYIKNSGLEKQWLLIVIGSLNQSSYEIDFGFHYDSSLNNGFDRIFLMEDFKARLFEI